MSLFILSFVSEAFEVMKERGGLRFDQECHKYLIKYISSSPTVF